jgi:HSP20 family molecular chaperone IbpA
MSTLAPLSLLEDLGFRPSSLLAQSLSQGLLGMDSQSPPPPIQLATHPYAPPSSVSGTAIHDKDGFHLNLDLRQFKQDEVVVKTAGIYLVIEAKHEETPDENRHIRRQMTRKYELPDAVDIEKIECSMSAEGVLSVKVPRKIVQTPDEVEEKIIPILLNTELPAKKDDAAAETEAVETNKEE